MNWRIPLSKPEILPVDRAAVDRVLASGTLCLGPELVKFEEHWSRRLSGFKCTAVSNGTAGLFLALRALDLPPGSVVVTPSYGFIATAHAIRLAGLTPRFCDVDSETFCTTVKNFEDAWTEEVRAVIPVHLFGTPAPMPEIMSWAHERGVAVVEDACEAVGAVSQGVPVGTFGAASVFAFYPNKQMTTGEGGLVVTRSEHYADFVRRFRNQGRGDREFEFVMEAFNFRLPEMACALGNTQLERLDQILAARAHVADQYLDALSSVSAVRTLRPVRAGDRRSWFVFPLVAASGEARARIRTHLHARGIQTSPYFVPIHQMLPYQAVELRCERLEVTGWLGERSFAVPFFNRLSGAEIHEVVKEIQAAVGNDVEATPEFDSAGIMTTTPD
ncbi:MAG: DegT/DnrJ/EryC1/StrS family aminotransferase [Planctomycetota bacterium]